MDASKKTVIMLSSVIVMTTFSGVSYADNDALINDSADKQNKAERNVLQHYSIKVSQPNGIEYKTSVNLNLRIGDSVNNSIITTMPKGSRVKHLGTTDKGWYKLDFNGKIGYANKMYLTQESNNTEISTTNSSGKEYKTVVNLNLRTGNTTNDSIITTMPKGSSVKHLGTTSNGWFKLEFNGKIGYAHEMYLTLSTDNNSGSNTNSPTKATTTTNLNMRTGSSTNHRIITTIPKGKQITIISKSNGWAKVKYGRNEGFVSARYLQESNGIDSSTPNRGETNRKPNTTTATRQKLVDVSLGLVNKVPYFWGGKSNTTGWNPEWNKIKEVTASGSSTTGKRIPFGLDCSGFIDWAYRTAGLGNVFSAGGTSYQWYNSYSINKSDALPGDVVFKQGPDGLGVNHIGIYIGESEGGQSLVVHSSYSRGGVVLTTIKEAGLTYFRRAKNIF